VDQLPSVGPGSAGRSDQQRALPVPGSRRCFSPPGGQQPQIITAPNAIKCRNIPDLLRSPPAETTTDFYFLPAPTRPSMAWP